jgi:hypothetical protein
MANLKNGLCEGAFAFLHLTNLSSESRKLPASQPVKKCHVCGSVDISSPRYSSEGLVIDPRWCRWGFFPKLPTEPCALGSSQPLKMSTRKTPGGKGGRCVRVTTYHLHSAESRDDPGALTSWNPKSHSRLVAENLYLF